MPTASALILEKLNHLYAQPAAAAAHRRLLSLINTYRDRLRRPANSALTEQDAMLITYADQVQTPGEAPLQTLARFGDRYLSGLVTALHLLPFYPWSSDDGFSVKDYRAVDPALGEWKDVEQLGRTYRLMVDGVINHVSAQGQWFQRFLQGDPRYQEFFIKVMGEPDLSRVVRPRALPLLTEFATAAGPQRLWTTFSADQVDLNYANPEVLLEIVDILLGYVSRGAQFIRLDAIAYLWKEIGTPCLHQPQTHAIIQLLRAVLAEVAPHVRLVTETNVPHADNVSYFGDGTNEAHLVYNFALPPLVLHTLRTGNAQVLSAWAAQLQLPSPQTCFFNFLASHDGIGLNPVRGILPAADIDALVAQTLAHGGRISYKHNSDGSQSPYELNVNYFDALSDPAATGRPEGEPLPLQVDRFMAAQAILLALAGLPGIYFHSLFGSRSWPEGVLQTGHNRAINRQKLLRADLELELVSPHTLRQAVFARYRRLLAVRATTPAFHPQGDQLVLDLEPGVFGLVRRPPAKGSAVVVLQNVTKQPQTVPLDRVARATAIAVNDRFTDMLTGGPYAVGPSQAVALKPYETVWLKSWSSAAA